MKKAIYGAGKGGRILFESLSSEGVKIDFFVDAFTEKKELFGVPIYRPEDAPKDTELFISISTFPVEMPKIVEKKTIKVSIPYLKKLGFKKIYTLNQIYQKYPKVKEAIFKQIFKNIDKKLSKISIPKEIKQQLIALFEDEKSKKIIEGLIKFLETLDINYYPPISEDVMYFPDFIRDYFKNFKEIYFLDIGGYKGDTIGIFLNLFPKSQKFIIAVEPVLEFLEDINEVVNFFKGKTPFQLIVIPSALYDKNVIVPFEIQGVASKVIEAEDKRKISSAFRTVPAVRLDDILHNIPVNYVKIDVEGADDKVLRGMERIIHENKPLLAVCIYHKPEHLWEIPFYIKKTFPFYKKFFVDCYAGGYAEIVLYCIPET
jgi:FkbM family methyltransferase